MQLLDVIKDLPLPLFAHWSYAVIFLSAVLEVIPLIGGIIPGQTIVIIGGFFARTGELQLITVTVVAVIGAIIGDFLGFMVGRRYGYNFISQYGKYLFFKPEYFEKTKKLMQEHAGKTLVVGRFLPMTRAFAPFVAGASEIKFGRFIWYSGVGALGWAVVSVAIGYLFGASYEVGAKLFGRIIFFAVVSGIAIAYGYRFLNKRKHIFEKYHLYTVALNIFALWVVAKMTEDVVSGGAILSADLWLNGYIRTFWHPAFAMVMEGFTRLMNPGTAALLSFIFLVVLIRRKLWYFALLFTITFGSGIVLATLIKLTVQRPRPVGGLILETGYSFPSLHATAAVLFFATLIYVVHRYITRPMLQRIFVAGIIALIILIGFSRIYLGVHWLSDVIAGFALGLFLLTFFILVFRIFLLFNRTNYGRLKKFFGSNPVFPQSQPPHSPSVSNDPVRIVLSNAAAGRGGRED